MKTLRVLVAVFLFAPLSVLAVSSVPYDEAVVVSSRLKATAGTLEATLTIHAESSVSVDNESVYTDSDPTESDVVLARLKPGQRYTVAISGGDSGVTGTYDLSFTPPSGYVAYFDNLPTDLITVAVSGVFTHTYAGSLEIRRAGTATGGDWGSFSGIQLGQSISWEIGLGNLRNGRSAGGIQFKERDLMNNPASRERLYYSVPANENQIVTVKDGPLTQTLRQVVTPVGFTDLVNVTNGYEIRFYTWSQVTGWSGSLYTFDGSQPWRVIEVIESGTNELTITERQGSKTRVSKLTGTGLVGVYGGEVTTSGSNTIHTFKSSGTLHVGGSLTSADYLVVGGGGGGGNSGGGPAGGGGAGDVRSSTGSLSGSYSVAVGAGGPSVTNGYASIFNGITAPGGGYGGGTPSSGGSGGGGGPNVPGAAAGSGVNVNAGGWGDWGAAGWQGGGGGGAGAAGLTASAGPGGNNPKGGDGITSSISGTATYYGGGGGGGAINSAGEGSPGLGGGGAGGWQWGGLADPNTGGGGGGAGNGYNGGSGGTGVVIVSYPSADAGIYTWTLQEGDDTPTWLRTTKHTSSVPASGQRDVVVEVRTDDTDGEIVSKTKYHYVLKAWGEELESVIADPDGDALTTSYTYYETLPTSGDPEYYGNYRRVKSITYPTGNWVAYHYFNDWNKRGQLHYEYHPFESTPAAPPTIETDAQADTASSSGRVVIQDYDYDWTGRYRFMVSRQTKINGVVTAKMTRDQDFDYSTTTPRIRYTQNDYSDATHYTQTHIQYWREDAIDADLVGQPYVKVLPHVAQSSTGISRGTYDPGNKDFEVDDEGDHWRKLTVHGSYTSDETYGETDEVDSYDGQSFEPVWLVRNKSTMDVVIRIAHGIIYRTEKRVWNGSTFELIAFEDFTYDGYGRLTQRLASNGAMTTYHYTDGLLDYTVAADGTRTEYDYDELWRVETATKKAATGTSYTLPGDIITTYTYDGANRVIEEEVSDGSSLTLFSSTDYDLAGRVELSTASGGYETEYGYDPANQEVMVTFPGGGEKITKSYLDGQLKSVTGSAVVEQHVTYSVNGTTGQITRKVNSESASSDSWVETTSDWLGRKVTETKPGWASSSTVTATWTYDSSYGYLSKVEQAGLADTLYKYDTMGGLVYQWLDVDGNGSLNLSSSDRITKSGWEFFQDGSSNWWRRETSSTYADATSSTATVVGKVETQLTGLATNQHAFTKSYDVFGNVTTTSVVVDRDNKKVTTTTVTPLTTDGDAEQIAYNGLVVKTTDAAGLIFETEYDGLGRPVASIDPRTGATTTSYKAGSNQVDTVEDPANVAQATYSYDPDSGQVTMVENADGKVVRYDYNLRGQKTHEWGNATYPIEYIYDDWGRLYQQKTYKDATSSNASTWAGNSLGTAATTTWNYQEKTGFLVSKTDDNGQGVVFTYTQAGQIETREWARLNGGNRVKTTYEYYAATGELWKQIYSNDDDLTPDVTYTYNRLGNVETVTDVTGTRTFEYNLTGGLELLSEELGDDSSDFYGDRLITYGYDSATGVVGRANAFMLGHSTDEVAYQSIEYGYQTATGRLGTVEDVLNDQIFTYGYATNSHLITSVTTDDYADTRVYDAHHNWIDERETEWDSFSRAKFAYVQDDMGRIKSVAKTSDANGLFHRYGSSNPGLKTFYGYNDRSELVTDQTVLDHTTASLSGATMLSGRDDEYAYDELGNRKTVTRHRNDPADAAGPTASTSTYTTNQLNQYTQRTVPNLFDITGFDAHTSLVEILQTGDATEYATKRHGDYFIRGHALRPGASTSAILSELQLIIDNGSPTAGRQAFLPADPEVMTSGYDLDGNLTSDGRWSYTYDAENRLVQMQTNTAAIPNASKQKLVFAYDYMGRRVRKTLYEGYNGTNYSATPVEDLKFVYQGWNMVGMINAKTSGEPIIANYVWGLDLSGSFQGAGGVGGLLMIQEDGNTFLPAYDAMGNLHALMTVSAATIDGTSYSAGDIVAAYEYDAFGRTIRESEAYAAYNPFRFSTKYTDVETSLVYYGHRYYSPDLGRFINRDPIEEQGGVNLYSFVRNNAVNGWDYLGMDAFMLTAANADGTLYWYEGDESANLYWKRDDRGDFAVTVGDDDTRYYENLSRDYFIPPATQMGFVGGDPNDAFNALVDDIQSPPDGFEPIPDGEVTIGDPISPETGSVFAPNNAGSSGGGSGLGDTLRRIPGVDGVLGVVGDVVAGTIGLVANIVTLGHASQWHYSRNAQNDAFLRDQGLYNRGNITQAELDNARLTIVRNEAETILHGQGNLKFTSGSGNGFWNRYGTYEVVVRPNRDGTFTHVNDPVNMGTLNRGNNPISHFFADVLPYLIYGNTPAPPAPQRPGGG